jgi:hypothetical protein
MKIKIIIENFTISTKLSKSIQVKDLLKQIKNSKIINSNGDEFKLLDNNYIILEETEFLKVPEEKIENKSNEKSTPQKNSFFINSNKSNNINDNNNTQFFEKPEDDTRFYLIKYPKLNNKKYSDPEDFKTANAKSSQKKEEIEDLIMKTTNAKAKIDTSTFKQTERSSAERLNLIDELINSSLGNIMGEIPNAPLRGNISQGSQNISQLLSILRPIIGSDMSEGDFVINRSSRGPGSIIINRAGYSRAPVAPDESLVNNLKEMGFPEEQCHRALVMGRNDISRATDLLLSGDLDYLPSEK